MAQSLIERAVKEAGINGVLGLLSAPEREALLYNWEAWARPNQLPPSGDWLTWLVQAGRGFGKNRTGSEWVRHRVQYEGARRIAFVGRTPADVRDTMVEGDSGILACYPLRERPVYESSKRRLTWPNGAMALTFTSYEPDQLRGPQFDTIFWDELAAFKYLRETWENGQLTLRLGPNPRQIVTTTPKPVTVLKELIAAPSTHVTRGSTYDNLINLAPAFRQQILSRYEGTARGRQEILGELIDEIPGALWLRRWFKRRATTPILTRLVVAIDPATTSGEESNETGIIVAGKGADGFGHVLADRSCRASPDAWARRAVAAYHEFKADRIVAESNQGGEMVGLTIKTVDNTVPVTLIHASRGKKARAEPIAALYEQGKVFHAGVFTDLEDQLCSWTPEDGESPDRLDALVWALSSVMLTSGKAPEVYNLLSRPRDPLANPLGLDLSQGRYQDRDRKGQW